MMMQLLSVPDFRRIGLSAAQQMPFRKLATPRCQTSSASKPASAASTSELANDIATIRIRALRRSKRSAATPRNAPNRPIGNSRSMLNIAMLTALNRPNQLKSHLEVGLNNGVTVEEIREILLQAAVYSGLPSAVDGFRIAEEVLKARKLLE